MAVRGQAPFAVHVHGLTSTLGASDESTARFQWTFGDPGGAYNTLVGWNAAHVYNQPGTYTLALQVTNVNREASLATMQIIVDPPARSAIYVSPWGNDASSGSSAASPVRTLGRADDLLGDNKAVYLQRGATFEGASGLSIAGRNVLVSAYGSGANPVIRYTSATPYTRIIRVESSAQDVVIENLELDSPFTVNKDIVRGIEVQGTNVTVRNCRFGDVSYAINTGGGGAYGLLTQENQCGNIGAYYAWIEGADQTHLGNVVGGSAEEHNIRFGGASRVLIAHCDLTNTSKTNIWCMLGDHAYVYKNTLRSGRLVAGPNFAVTYPTDHFDWMVAESNEFIDATVSAYDGASRLALRNNIIRADGRDAIAVWGFSAARGRTVSDVVIAHNTIINNSDDYGRALTLGDGAPRVSVIGNLHAAPALNAHNGGNVVCDAPSLETHAFLGNIWATPQIGPRVHEINGWLMSAADWNAQPQTTGEVHRDFGGGDLDGAARPLFNAAVLAFAPGVLTDFYSNPRPAAGATTAGAVETSQPAPPSSNGDVDGNGIVNIDDLLAVTASWGSCSACDADQDGDGLVNINDLLVVIAGWG
jgi:PKD repeat protein